ncbi:hypothetical protein AX760_23065 [Pararhizobium antarcticum]|uniref:Uncharacterized protein n=1 Tax=Pararhizobium antarcticum TaxID=1798805 RepID=A0A657LN28_9HYPH|nr:hypothetical protein AX760_23065 [Pararhizobium antarcticum]OJF96134.1 hypothetical protein AX761_16360 [Rhizobium sp. 58]
MIQPVHPPGGNTAFLNRICTVWPLPSRGNSTRWLRDTDRKFHVHDTVRRFTGPDRENGRRFLMLIFS